MVSDLITINMSSNQKSNKAAAAQIPPKEKNSGFSTGKKPESKKPALPPTAMVKIPKDGSVRRMDY